MDWREAAFALLHHPYVGVALKNIATAGVFFALTYGLERLTGERTAQYRTRHFRDDLVYWFAYQWGAMTVIMAVVHQTVGRIPGLDLRWLAGWPSVPHYLLWWIVSDFVAYWVHRLFHASPYLWAFHLTHHSQEVLTFATVSRNHPIDQYAHAAANFVLLALLGAPPDLWLPLQLVSRTLPAVLLHSELAWRYGPLFRLFVSPAFHAVHHSVQERHHNRNFGDTLSVWDFLFGTAVDEAERPRVYGVDGVRFPTLLSQHWLPFRIAFATFQRRTGERA